VETASGASRLLQDQPGTDTSGAYDHEEPRSRLVSAGSRKPKLEQLFRDNEFPNVIPVFPSTSHLQGIHSDKAIAISRQRPHESLFEEPEDSGAAPVVVAPTAVAIAMQGSSAVTHPGTPDHVPTAATATATAQPQSAGAPAVGVVPAAAHHAQPAGGTAKPMTTSPLVSREGAVSNSPTRFAVKEVKEVPPQDTTCDPVDHEGAGLAPSAAGAPALPTGSVKSFISQTSGSSGSSAPPRRFTLSRPFADDEKSGKSGNSHPMDPPAVAAGAAAPPAADTADDAANTAAAAAPTAAKADAAGGAAQSSATSSSLPPAHGPQSQV
jgi:hypothetical protein